jgi:hypothetical protein
MQRRHANGIFPLTGVPNTPVAMRCGVTLQAPYGPRCVRALAQLSALRCVFLVVDGCWPVSPAVEQSSKTIDWHERQKSKMSHGFHKTLFGVALSVWSVSSGGAPPERVDIGMSSVERGWGESIHGHRLVFGRIS